jgi:hypothetical protein
MLLGYEVGELCVDLVCLSTAVEARSPDIIAWGEERRRYPLPAVRRVSRSQWNGGFGADSGPSRGDPIRPAFRPMEASKSVVCYVRSTRIGTGDTQSLNAWQARLVPSSANARSAK